MSLDIRQKIQREARALMVSLHAVGVERTTKQLTTTASIIAARRGHHAPQAVHRVLRNCNLDSACFRWMVAYLEKELECEEP